MKATHSFASMKSTRTTKQNANKQSKRRSIKVIILTSEYDFYSLINIFYASSARTVFFSSENSVEFI